MKTESTKVQTSQRNGSKFEAEKENQLNSNIYFDPCVERFLLVRTLVGPVEYA